MSVNFSPVTICFRDGSVLFSYTGAAQRMPPFAPKARKEGVTVFVFDQPIPPDAPKAATSTGSFTFDECKS